MKFMFFMLPTIPATLAERKELRPIAMRQDRWDRMLEEITELSQLAEEVGFDGVCFPEHHCIAKESRWAACLS
jgi:alkanesulfonate monooxygenase SsuD/methylene tetrahydromethanopterin reductase-like flavin-dependent oxidoreductase (luciferase family)